MCPSGETCLPADCFFIELALFKSNSACWARINQTSSSSHWKLTCSRHDKTQSLTHSNWVFRHTHFSMNKSFEVVSCIYFVTLIISYVYIICFDYNNYVYQCVFLCYVFQIVCSRFHWYTQTQSMWYMRSYVNVYTNINKRISK